VATLLGVPAGAWLGLQLGWRATFWAVAAVGIAALLIIATLVPADKKSEAPIALRDELRAIARPQVLLGLLMTVFGFAGVFAVFTYIQPLLTRMAGFSEAAVSPILLVFGIGLVAGNFLGGRLADRRLAPALLGTLAALTLVLVLMSFAVSSQPAIILFTGLLGLTAFATVAPLQLRVLQKAEGAGQSMASSLNIAAFNLGNAIGAWLGGATIAYGLSLAALPWVAAALSAIGLAVATWSVLLDKPQRGTASKPVLTTT
jgi:DHA1 family inner membrane transport protein